MIGDMLIGNLAGGVVKVVSRSTFGTGDRLLKLWTNFQTQTVYGCKFSLLRCDTTTVFSPA